MDNNILNIAIYVLLIALLLGTFWFIQKKRRQVKNEASSVATFNKKIQDILNKLETPEEKIAALGYALEKIENNEEYNRNQAWKNSLKVTIYLYMTIAYNEMGDDAKLLETYNTILGLNTKHAITYYNRGCMYYRKHQYEEALSDLQQVLDLDKKDKWGLHDEIKEVIAEIKQA
ncbi:tetratricopeptide repeat protein [Dysgonomonas sp. 25]|uniref:tetratricopeptide repeat protein n=1 Tax=Dysgonomonas sp. 25 TaxID=2302933 RepID=UPI0013D6FF55|nr:tetratricopeptide repeat protein [Dysgonomonas sp. 25]NDV69547.1 tetratricopeptide repeat protein [Dysgonomonas sp. 25]